MKMPDCCSQKNPLVRNGTSQAERLLKALVPSYIKIDEKSIEDTLAFAHRYAQLIKFYDSDNQSSSNWQQFYEISMTVLLAVISTAPFKAVENDINSHLKEFADNPAPDIAKAILDMVWRMLAEIQHWNQKISPGHQFKSIIVKEIDSQLKTRLNELAPIDKSLAVIDASLAHTETPVYPANDYRGFYTTDWGFDKADCDSLALIAVSDLNVLADMVDDLKAIYEIVIKSYGRIIREAKTRFQSNIAKESGHQPHITLFISFLYLLQYAKDYLNSLPKSHLDFFYKDVLRLEKMDQVPDNVHVIFGLAENQSSHKLEKGTALKAGKDADGKPLSYELAEELVVNKAAVDQLKTVYLDPDKNYRIHAAPQADSADGSGGEFDEGSDGNWKPFGSAAMPPATVGIAIASPILLLKEGERTITLTLNLDGAIANLTSADNLFRIQLSTAEGWLDIDEQTDLLDFEELSGFKAKIETAVIDNTEYDKRALQFTIRLKSEDPAVVAYDAAVHNDGFDTAWPVVKIYFNENSETSAYGDLKDRKLNTIDIEVDCEGVRDLIVQNDQTVFDPNASFLPFGPRPAIGSNFYIGSAEVFGKKLNTLSVVIEWLDLPPSGDFQKHYCVYNALLNANIKNDSFKVIISYLENKKWTPLFKNEGQIIEGQNLFKAPDNEFTYVYYHFANEKMPQLQYNIAPPLAIMGAAGASTVADDGPVGASDPVYTQCKPEATGETEETAETEATKATEATEGTTINISSLDLKSGGIETFDRYDGILSLGKYTSNTQRGFLKLQLSGKDFQHSRYSEAYTKQALKLANKVTDETTTIFPNEPYTPNIKSIYLNYTSRVTVEFPLEETKSPNDARLDQVFHIYPFGHRELHSDLAGEDIRAVPQFTMDGELYKGHLYIGLKGALASQTLSLLFQVYDGSGDPENEIPQIKWLYLKDNQWQPFAEADILFDGTNGLLKSGILRLLLPADITSDNTVLDNAHLWIKGSIKASQHIEALPDIIDIKAQAAVAVFKDNDNAVGHLASALPAETISKLSQRTPAIKSVSQPHASYGGKIKESDSDFYRRISERLRHKNRAVTIWDYERLVLQAFPSVHKVKCLNHTSRNTEIAPGCVMVVVIPDLRNKNAVNRLEPKVDVGTLADIRDFLAGRNTPFVKGGDEDIPDPAREKLLVMNPLYEQVKVVVKVKMKKDPQYYKKVLNDDLKRFLAPWAYEAGAPISFGSALHRSVILNFIEKQDYVDFLTDLKLEHYREKTFQGVKDEIITDNARAILTSYETPAPGTGLEHDITTDAGCK